jgi:hypothetical protein
MGVLYGRAGRLTAQNGGFWPGQYGQSLVQPTVWTGLETDFDHATGRLEKNGSYYAGYITTSGGATWGGVPMNISDYLFGAQHAFASDCYGSRAMRRVGGCPDPMLSPATPPKNQVRKISSWPRSWANFSLF